MPRLLIFDLDGTLYSQRRLRALLAPRLAAYTLVRPVAGWRAAKILRAYRKALEALRREAPPHRLPDAQIEWTCRATGYGPGAVRACIEEWFERRPLPLLPRCLRPGLPELLNLGIPAAVFSDYDPVPKLEALGLAGGFAAALWAGHPRVYALKPHPRGLQTLLEQFGARPEQAVCFGDRQDVDGAAARSAGIPFELIGEAGFGAAARRIVTQYAQ